MKTMIRCQSLDMAGLAAAEAHGKRQDRTSQLRRVRDVSPLVAGGLDLRKLYDAHMDGVRQNKGAKKPVLHFIVRFPPEVLSGASAGQFQGNQAERQKVMLRQAARFINDTHGGQAVFAVRLDRDEAGETIVDVFAAPKYEKRTKRTKPDQSGVMWASATRFGKELAEKHQDEIQRRHPNAKGKLLGPRHVGIALNSEWRDYFESENDLTLVPKQEKETGSPDRLEIEAYKEASREMSALELKSETLDRAEEELDRREAELEQRAAQINERRRDLDQRERKLTRLEGFISRMIETIADKLGVRRDLEAIAEEITRLDAVQPSLDM